MAKEREPEERIYLYSSSHFRKDHYFPQHFNPLFKRSKRFFPPVTYAEPGGVIDQDLVDEVIERASQVSPRKQVIVINYGDNNIRENERLSDIFPYFSQLLDRLQDIPFCSVVLTSVVPNFGRDEDTKEDFNSLNNFLKSLCNDNPRAHYLCIVRRLFVNGNLHQDYFDDAVHLSSEGARIMAEAIHHRLVFLPRIKN